jgi:hypothetical protein
MPKFEVVDNYLSQLRSEEWRDLLENKKFNFRDDHLLFERVRLTVFMSLSEQTKQTRQHAWLLMLGIDLDGAEFKNH